MLPSRLTGCRPPRSERHGRIGTPRRTPARHRNQGRSRHAGREVCIHIYIYIGICILLLVFPIYIYIYVCVCVCVCVYIPRVNPRYRYIDIDIDARLLIIATNGDLAERIARFAYIYI